MVEHSTCNNMVEGLNPTEGTLNKNEANKVELIVKNIAALWFYLGCKMFYSTSP
jgi:hypothetical protein